MSNKGMKRPKLVDFRNSVATISREYFKNICVIVHKCIVKVALLTKHLKISNVYKLNWSDIVEKWKLLNKLLIVLNNLHFICNYILSSGILSRLCDKKQFHCFIVLPTSRAHMSEVCCIDSELKVSTCFITFLDVLLRIVS